MTNVYLNLLNFDENWLWYLQYSAVKGESSMPLVTYCCSISYGALDLFFLLTKGQFVRLVNTSGSRSSPLPFTLCSWMISFFAVQFSLAF